MLDTGILGRLCHPRIEQIPRLFGAGVRKQAAPGVSSPRSRKSGEPEFLAAAADLPPALRDAVQKLYFASREMADDLGFGRGSINPRFYHASQKSFYTLRLSGSLVINLKWHGKSNAGERAAGFRDRSRQRLNEAGFAIPDEPYPGLAPSAWASKVDEFIRVVQDVLTPRA